MKDTDKKDLKTGFWGRILKYRKKMGFWGATIFLIVSVILLICTISNPSRFTGEGDKEALVNTFATLYSMIGLFLMRAAEEVFDKKKNPVQFFKKIETWFVLVGAVTLVINFLYFHTNLINLIDTTIDRIGFYIQSVCSVIC